MQTADFVIIGAGVMGCSTAFHLAQMGGGRIRVLDRRRIAEGTTAQSSAILRTHYSVPENIELARLSWDIFHRFASYLEDEQASAGLVRCGYLIVAPQGPRREALQAVLDQQKRMGIEVHLLTPEQARERMPLAHFESSSLIGWEPHAGFADAYLISTGFARAARRLGVVFSEGVEVQGLLLENGRVCGVKTNQGDIRAATVISTQNIWAQQIQQWLGVPIPLQAERHRVLALKGPRAYTPEMPVFKDLGSPSMFYARSYGGQQMLVSEGLAGEVLDGPDDAQGDIPMDFVAALGGEVAARFPGFEQAALASSWTGVYDVTPDWNPVLDTLHPGLLAGFGFSGHGLKLSPAIGRLLAQQALGRPTDVSLAPYALSRFDRGALLRGRYGQGAVS